MLVGFVSMALNSISNIYDFRQNYKIMMSVVENVFCHGKDLIILSTSK